MGQEGMFLSIYILGIIVNLTYLFLFEGKDRMNIHELDEDAGLVEGLFVGLFLGPLYILEGFAKTMLCMCSWFTSIGYILYMIWFYSKSDEGRYKLQKRKYLKQIKRAITEWSHCFRFDKVEIRNGHINIYYKDDYCADSPTNEKYILKHVRKAIDSFPTLIPHCTIHSMQCNGGHNYGKTSKTKIYLNYSLQDYTNKC